MIPQSLFTDGDKVLLSKEQLADGFTLKGKAYDIDFTAADDEIVKVDVETGRSVPRAYQMEAADQRYFKEHFSSLPPESQIKNAIYYRSVDMRGISDPKERERYADIKRAVALDPVDYEAEYDAAMARRDMCADSSFG